jgi:hypothetical protein
MRSSLSILAAFVVIAGCTKDWSDRELVPVSVNLAERGTFTISIPSGLNRTSVPGPLAIYDTDGNDGPYVMLAALTFSDDSADAFIAATPDGSDFEKRDVPGGFGVVYESGGPHAHVVKKIGATYLTCDASFSGGTKDRAKRLDLIWRICTSMK